MALQQETSDRGDIIIPADVVVRHEVSMGSTFRTNRRNVSGLKKRIEDHRRVNRELTADEARYESTYGHIVLM